MSSSPLPTSLPLQDFYKKTAGYAHDHRPVFKNVSQRGLQTSRKEAVMRGGSVYTLWADSSPFGLYMYGGFSQKGYFIISFFFFVRLQAY